MSVPATTTFDPVFDSQRVFRCVLRATAQPGRIFALPPVDFGPTEALALALLDHEVSFCVIGGEDGERISRLTGARRAPVREADFALVAGGHGARVSRLKRGTLERPETGATAIIAVGELADAGALTFRLSGPGVPGERTLGVEGMTEGEAGSVLESRRGYPLGVDVYLVDGAGRVAGLPRSTGLEVV